MKLRVAILAASALLTSSLAAGDFGTGFAISPKGYLVTCHHVVKNADQVLIHTKKGTLPASIIAMDPRNDLAILKVETWEGSFLGLASASEVNYGSEVTVAGFPDPGLLGVNPKISKGIVNSLSGVRDDPRFLQISAPVQPGNSGGPLVSQSGRAVAVVVSGLDSMARMNQGGYVPQTVNYAVKVDLVYPLLKNASVSVPTFGTRTKKHAKQIDRAIGAIALIEGARQQANPPLHGRPSSPARPELRMGAPWVFPNSHRRPLQTSELRQLSRGTLWRARNEIYLRHGFHFTSPEGRSFASEFGSLYRPQTDSVAVIQRTLSPVEISNLQVIAAFEENR